MNLFESGGKIFYFLLAQQQATGRKHSFFHFFCFSLVNKINLVTFELIRFIALENRKYKKWLRVIYLYQNTIKNG